MSNLSVENIAQTYHEHCVPGKIDAGQTDHDQVEQEQHAIRGYEPDKYEYGDECHIQH